MTQDNRQPFEQHSTPTGKPLHFLTNPRPPSAQTLATEVLDYDERTGEVHARFYAPASFTSPRGTIQGGLVAGFIDDIIGLPVLVVTDGQLAPLTLDLRLSYMKPVPVGTIYGKARIVKLGRKIGFLEAELYSEQGEVLVRSSTTVMLHRHPRARDDVG